MKRVVSSDQLPSLEHGRPGCGCDMSKLFWEDAFNENLNMFGTMQLFCVSCRSPFPTITQLSI